MANNVIEDIFLLRIDEWENFLERIGRGDTGDTELQDSTSDALELRFWASYRGQTLARTGRLVLHRVPYLLMSMSLWLLKEIRTSVHSCYC